jgi:DNA polymerase I
MRARLDSTIRDPAEFQKIKDYCVHDSDDALALYDLMVPSYFYLTQSIPKSFSSIIATAPGSQINSFLVRSYLQEGHSLPKSTEQQEYVGAISIGNPGIYKYCFKVDVASLYPSIMLQYKVHDSAKDPDKNFLKMVEYFTTERLANKKRAKDTGDNYYKDLEQSQKIVINSAYGMLGAPGLLFNSPKNAAFVTRTGREILQNAINWAASNDFQLVNADTDSILISDGDEINSESQIDILNSINSMFPERIRFENDGYYDTVLVVKSKNYCLWDGKKLKIKGSALKGTYKERALSEFMQKFIQILMFSEGDKINEAQILYRTYIHEIFNLTDISRWASKKTITESVLNPERTNEERVADAIKDEDVSMGDKVYVYFKVDGTLSLQANWANDHDTARLCEKLFKTIKIFESVIDIKLFPNYKLKRNKALLEAIV